MSDALKALADHIAGGLIPTAIPTHGTIKAATIEQFNGLLRELGIPAPDPNNVDLTKDQCRLVLETIQGKEEDNLISSEAAYELRAIIRNGWGIQDQGLSSRPPIQGSPAPSEQKANERLLKLTEAKLAKEFGYELCLCTFPPSEMLWRETEKANVCPACGRQSKQSKKWKSKRK